MIRFSVSFIAMATILLLAGVAQAQQEPGARTAGGTYVPSTHTAGCGGVLCDGNNPERAAGAPPPPPCQGLLCSVSPYSMQRPVTASEVQRIQEEQSRAAAATPAPAEPATKIERKHKAKKAAKAKAPAQKSAAVRTPDPGAPAPEPR